MKDLEDLLNKKDINWINYLVNTKETNYNFERIKSLKELSNDLIYKYVLNCFKVLESIKPNNTIYYYVSETLKWMEVSKVGSKEDRRKWKKLGFDLYVHNIGSSQIYTLENEVIDEVIRVLIFTHGLIGQNIRGEVNLNKNFELYKLIENKLIDKETLKEVLEVLNECIIKPVSEKLFYSIKENISIKIEKILNGDFNDDLDLTDRFIAINKITNKSDLLILNNEEVFQSLKKIFEKVELWYYLAALIEFDILERTKILLFLSNNLKDSDEHITFELMMKSIYFDYEGKKTINIYKKRIIESFLKSLSIEDIINNNIKKNPHISFVVNRKNNTILFYFTFSIQASKLIEFCEVAYTSNSLYNKAVYLLYDLFGFRRDNFDRFYNEIEYINTMNSSLNNKKILIDYIVGKNVLDIGPGGGVILDLIEEYDNNINLYGIDISENICEELKKKKEKENKNWTIIKGDALYLENYFEEKSMDTIIFSSIIHEMFSYIEYNEKKFNIETVIKVLKSAYNLLSIGGRIIIRDGIKTEPENKFRIIEFKDKKDISILNNYCMDFKGRSVTYEKIDDYKVKMLVNDAMEFLYTYTWGENSYSLEVQEQFGYLTPSEYRELIIQNLPNANIIELKSFLQSGYEENLLNKITLYDENMNVTKLPNSTCIIVIERN